MKRVFIALACAGLLSAGFMAWSFGGNVTAEGDEISALQTQVAELDARVTALEAAAVIGTPGSTWHWHGLGVQTINIGVVPAGDYIVTVSYPSSSDQKRFMVDVVAQSNLQRIWLVTGEMPPVNVTTKFINPLTSVFTMTVYASDDDTPWIVTMRQAA